MRLNMRRVLPTISRIFVRLIATLLDRIEEQLLHEPATDAIRRSWLDSSRLGSMRSLFGNCESVNSEFFMT